MISRPSRRCRCWRGFPVSSPRTIPHGGTGGSGLERLRRSWAWRSLLVYLTTSPRETNNWFGCSKVNAPEMAPKEMAESLEIDEHLVSLFAPNSYEAEQYRTLAHTIELMHKDFGLQVLAVTSALPGDGKTTTTINLAGALAQSPDARVLLMCADLRKPSVIEHLGMEYPHPVGLATAILNPGQTLTQVVQRLGGVKLLVPPSCPFLAHPHEAPQKPQ